MNILNSIGHTPLVKIGNVYAKVETFNPSGSIKDRMTKFMIERAEKQGKLKPGYYIIEATSGNTGVSFAMISSVKGYNFVAVIPDTTSEGKKKLLKMFGARLVLMPEKQGFQSMIKKTEELAKELKKAWLPHQFANHDNVEAHRLGLGQEIKEEVPQIDAFVAGIGTGGTLMGVAKALKLEFPEAKMFGMEAAEAHHHIEGISDGIVPDILDQQLIDGMIKIKSEQAIEMSRKLARDHGLLVGISSGGNFLAAKKLTDQYENVVTVFPDRAERYLDQLIVPLKNKS